MGIAGPLARSRRAIGAALAAALFGLGAPAGSQPEPGEVRLEISSYADWTPTGIVVQPGDALVITVDADGSLPPGGFANLSPEQAPAPDLQAGALIGRIGDSPPFLVGADYKGRVALAGDVSLRLNYGGRQRPQGSVLAVVRHQRATPIEDPDENKTNSGGTDASGPANPIDGNGATGEEVSNLAIGNGSAPVGEYGSGPGRLDPGEEESVPEPEPAVEPEPESRLQAALPWLGWAVLGLLAAAAAAVSLRRWQRRRTVERTRAQLSLSPSLDLGEGRSGVGDWPAEGPAASLRARLEEGAIRSVEGGEDE